MQQKLLTNLIASLLLFLAACALPGTPAPASNLSPAAANQPATPLLQLSSTPMVSEQAVIPSTSPTEQAQPESTKKSKSQKSPSSTPGSSTTQNSKSQNPAAGPTSASPDFIASEITGRPTNNSITVNIVPSIAMEIYYEYGTASGAYTAKTTPQNAAVRVPLETLISGLQPNTRYYYRLNYNGVAGVERSFVTQRTPGSAFTFDLQGDSHPERTKNQFDANLYTRTLNGAASDDPDFYIAMGDDFSVDTLKTVNPQTVTERYINQRQWLGLVGAPVFLVNGNHEQASMANLNGTADNVAVWAQLARNSYYPEPAPDAFYTGDTQQVQFIGQLRDYYAFTWGDALFVMIDPYWHSSQTVDNQFGSDHTSKGNRDLWNVTLGDAQYQWFKQTLATSTAKYKFVFTHHVLGTGRGGIELANGYEWGDTAGLAAHRPGWDKTIQQIMADNHVTIFFQGHDHIFVHQQLDGVIYQTLPEPANPFYSWENVDAYKTGDKYPNSGRVRVTVSLDGVKVDYIRSYLDKPDEVAFSYTVK